MEAGVAEDMPDEDRSVEVTGEVPGYLCPSCASANTRRSHRRGWEHLLRVIAFRAYQCLDCGHRYYRRW